MFLRQILQKLWLVKKLIFFSWANYMAGHCRSMGGAMPPCPISIIFCTAHFFISPHILREFHQNRKTFRDSFHITQKYSSMGGATPPCPISNIFCMAHFFTSPHILCEF